MRYILITVLAIFVGVFVWQNLDSPPDDLQVSQEVPDEASDWEVYTNRELGFSIKYPPHIEPLELEKPIDREKYVYFGFSGPTQVDGTEPYDAISLYFENVITFNIEEYIENEVHLAVACVAVANECGGIVEESPHEFMLGSRKGYTAVVSGGFHHFLRFIYLPLNDTRFLALWYDTPAPTQEQYEEYQNTVSQMLATLEFLE